MASMRTISGLDLTETFDEVFLTEAGVSAMARLVVRWFKRLPDAPTRPTAGPSEAGFLAVRLAGPLGS